MHELYEGIELNATQTALICRGLLDLAAVDGVHETEAAFIKEFYSASGGDFAELDDQSWDMTGCTKALKACGDNVVEAFIMSAYLLIYADGTHSDAERARMGEYGEGLGLTTDHLEELHVKARLLMLRQLAEGLRNKDAIRYVGASLGLGADQIASVEG